MIKLIRDYFSNLNQISGYPQDIRVPRFPFQTEPREYLAYAEKNLKVGDIQANGDALANVKRALDCQLDFFLRCYGLANLSKLPSTGKKIEIIGDLGGVPKGILQRINEERNNLEHRYESPSRMTAENAMDIVGLFIEATDIYLFPTREGVIFNELAGEKRELLLQVNATKGVIFAELKQDDKIYESEFIAQTESVYNSDYMFLLTFLLNSHRLDMRNPSLFFDSLKYIKRSI